MKALMVLVLCLPVVAFAQQSTSSPANKVIECVRAWDTPGCKSFQEMTSRGDEDILAQLRPPQHAFVCFPANTDGFIIVSYAVPAFSVFSPKPYTGHPDGVAALAVIKLAVYRDGIQSWSWPFVGHWMAADRKLADLAFVSDIDLNAKQPQDFAAVDDSEVQIQYTHTNTSGGRTVNLFTVRRSTLRFRQSLHGTIRSDGQEKEKSAEESGYCAEFK